MSRFEIIDERTVVDVDGVRHDVFESVERLPWVDQLCPLMPHQYAHLNRSDPLAYRVVEHMLKAANPDTYRAYFRGYRSPNRYWDAPDGQRYWLTRMMINRCWPTASSPCASLAMEPSRSKTGAARPGLRTASASTRKARKASGGRRRQRSPRASSHAKRVAGRTVGTADFGPAVALDGRGGSCVRAGHGGTPARCGLRACIITLT